MKQSYVRVEEIRMEKRRNYAKMNSMEFKLSKINIYGYCLFFLAILASLAIWGGIIYKLHALDSAGAAVASFLSLVTICLLVLIRRRSGTPEPEIDRPETNRYANYLAIGYVVIFFACVCIVWTHSTDRAIVSPWQVVPKYFFVLYFFSSLALGILAAGRYRLSMVLICLHYLLSLSIIALVYRLGFGFDSFVHLSTLELIDKQGAVEPRPFYYLGQYGLFMILHKFTAIPIGWLIRWSLPLLSAVTLPILFLETVRRWLKDHSYLIVMLPLAIPLSIFTFTTPQNFGYFFLTAAVLLGLSCASAFDLALIYLFSIAAVLIQPLAGLPALIFSSLLTIYHSDGLSVKIKNIGYGLISVVSVVILPALFYFFDATKNISWSNLTANLRALAPTAPGFAGSENIFLNAAYLYGFNLHIILAISIIAGLAIFWRIRASAGQLKIYLIMGATMAAAAVFSLVVPFSFLIDYERGDYAERIMIEAIIFLSPFIWLALSQLAGRAGRLIRVETGIWLVFLACLTTASLYLEYPRIDNYFNSRGYSTGAADVQAVEWINADASGDYIVLSDQQVSAAALLKFGFLKYYDKDLFYYPIPTSSPLYQYYLDMVYKKPDKTTMTGAMDLARVDGGYFVLNKYWWAFPKILDEAKFAADSWKSFGDGQVYVFKFKR